MKEKPKILLLCPEKAGMIYPGDLLLRIEETGAEVLLSTLLAGGEGISEFSKWAGMVFIVCAGKVANLKNPIRSAFSQLENTPVVIIAADQETARRSVTDFPEAFDCVALEEFDRNYIAATIRHCARFSSLLSGKAAVIRSASEELARHSEAQIGSIIENSPIGICVMNENGLIEYSNPVNERLLGYSSDEVRGTHFGNYIFEKDKLLIHREFNNFIAGRSYSIPDELEIKAKDLRAITTILKPVEIKTHDGRKKIVLFMVDITERKKMEHKFMASNEFCLTLFEEFPALVWRSGTDSNFNYFNKTWLSFTGKKVEDEIGDGWKSSFHPDDVESFQKVYMISFNNRSPFEANFRLKRANGGYRWMTCVGRPFVDINGSFAGFICACFDITEQKKFEEQIRQLNEGLDRKVADRTKQLEKVNRELSIEIEKHKETEEKLRLANRAEKEIGEMKTQFISTVSHDFRTPLSVILSSTELLEYYGDKLGEEKKKEHLKRIQDTVGRMTNLLNDILFINKVDSDKMKFNPAAVDIVQLFNEIASEMKLVAGDQVSVASGADRESHMALIDEKLFRHIIVNVVSNAVKYSKKPGGTVTMNMAVDGDRITFTVRDSGIGIPVEDREKLFEPFHRARNVGNIQGTGLGLSIVKRCVDMHGGTISFESAPGLGTTFTVVLPSNRISA